MNKQYCIAVMIGWAFAGTMAGMMLGNVGLAKYQDGLVFTCIGLLGSAVHLARRK